MRSIGAPNMGRSTALQNAGDASIHGGSTGHFKQARSGDLAGLHLCAVACSMFRRREHSRRQRRLLRAGTLGRPRWTACLCGRLQYVQLTRALAAATPATASSLAAVVYHSDLVCDVLKQRLALASAFMCILAETCCACSLHPHVEPGHQVRFAASCNAAVYAWPPHHM